MLPCTSECLVIGWFSEVVVLIEGFWVAPSWQAVIVSRTDKIEISDGTVANWAAPDTQPAAGLTFTVAAAGLSRQGIRRRNMGELTWRCTSMVIHKVTLDVSNVMTILDCPIYFLFKFIGYESVTNSFRLMTIMKQFLTICLCFMAILKLNLQNPLLW